VEGHAEEQLREAAMSHEMEMEDFIRAKDMQIGALSEELHRERMNSERLEAEIANLYHAAQKATRQHLELSNRNFELTKRLQDIADDANIDIQLAALRRAEAEALEL
jgi:hypothetical protein